MESRKSDLKPDSGQADRPGEQRSTYESATPENVEQATKEQNSLGAPGSIQPGKS